MSQTEEHGLQSGSPTTGNSEVTSGGEGAPISLDDATVDALLSHPKVAERLGQIADQTVKQPVKDRRIARLEKDVQDILGKLDLTPEQQKRYADIQQADLLERLQEAVFSQSPSGQEVAKPGPGATLDIVGAYKEAGFDINNLSLEDVEFAEKFTGSQAELKTALLKRRLTSTSAGPEVSTSGSIPTSGSQTPARPGSQGALQAEYEAQLAKIRPGAVDQIARLKQAFRQRGLDVF